MFRPVVKEPRALFLSQRNGAERRGIPWRFTFDEWWALWAPHWERRVPDKLCLCREGDAGEYAPGNCRIDTAENNLREEHEVIRTRGYREKGPLSPETLDNERIMREVRRERFERMEYSLPDTMREIERAALLDALEKHRWNQTRAAESLGLTFRQMRYKMKDHKL